MNATGDNWSRFAFTLGFTAIFAGTSSALLAWLGLATVDEVLGYFGGALLLLLAVEAGRWLERTGR